MTWGLFTCYSFATCGGAGYFPLAPGTIGSIIGFLLWWVAPHYSYYYEMIFLGALTILASYAADRVARSMSIPDPSIIVIDEVVGVWVALMLIPKDFLWGLCALGLFRFFDIVKPYPIYCAERLPYGYGIVVDDVVAGFLSGVVTVLLVRYVAGV